MSRGYRLPHRESDREVVLRRWTSPRTGFRYRLRISRDGNAEVDQKRSEIGPWHRLERYPRDVVEEMARLAGGDMYREARVLPDHPCWRGES